MLSYPEASRLLHVPIEFPDPGPSILSFSIDTRTLQEGEFFIALTGRNTDGHDHVEAAYEKGASGVLISVKKRAEVLARLQKVNVKPRNVLAAANPEKTMTSLAVHYRAKMGVRTIGVTGSVGKTTTREFLYFLLRQKYSAIATAGNLNNHLGVPIMLSRLKPEHRFAVLELGASHVGEIAYLAGLIRPSGAVFTPIGPAHLGEFGSFENIYKTKTEIAEFLEKDDPIVIPDNDERLRKFLEGKNGRIISAGYSEKADFRISGGTVENGAVKFTINGNWHFSFPGQAPFLALNAGLAVAMAAQWGISLDEMPRDWRDAGFASGRFRETILPNGIRVIDDSYNASPLAFFHGIEAFERIPCDGKKILVFADMLELGPEEARFHRELGEKIAKTRIDHMFAFGDRSRVAIEAVLSSSGAARKAKHFPGAEELAGFLRDIVRPGDLVFLKGSREMRVERVLERIRELVFSNS